VKRDGEARAERTRVFAEKVWRVVVVSGREQAKG
jgi:hypothetical protein